jgi:hypothetical protein
LPSLAPWQPDFEKSLPNVAARLGTATARLSAFPTQVRIDLFALGGAGLTSVGARSALVFLPCVQSFDATSARFDGGITSRDTVLAPGDFWDFVNHPLAGCEARVARVDALLQFEALSHGGR